MKTTRCLLVAGLLGSAGVVEAIEVHFTSRVLAIDNSAPPPDNQPLVTVQGINYYPWKLLDGGFGYATSISGPLAAQPERLTFTFGSLELDLPSLRSGALGGPDAYQHYVGGDLTFFVDRRVIGTANDFDIAVTTTLLPGWPFAQATALGNANLNNGLSLTMTSDFFQSLDPTPKPRSPASNTLYQVDGVFFLPDEVFATPDQGGLLLVTSAAWLVLLFGRRYLR